MVSGKKKRILKHVRARWIENVMQKCQGRRRMKEAESIV
jgi:hypothetical protein